jgi:replicative DNA helicase
MSKDNNVPPHNLEAEQSLLGSLLVDKDAVTKVADMVNPRDFYSDRHRIVFETVIDLFEKHAPLDFLALGNRLEEKNALEKVGGRAYLAKLQNAVPTSAHVKHYAEIVQKKATLRRLLNAAGKITELGYEEESDIETTLDEAEQAIFNVSQKFLKESFVPVSSVLQNAFDRIDELHKNRGKLRGVPTGFKGLDDTLAGLQKSDLIILAARPSVGKTSLALDIARNVGIKAGVPTGIFSLEMSKEQLVDRMICAEAGVNLWRLRTGKLSDKDDDFPNIGKAIGDLSEAPLYIDDTASLSILQLRTKARRLKSEHGLGLLIIDYLQLMEATKRTSGDNRVQEVAEISRGLKQIGRELDVPVLALAQLSRGVESRKPSIPRLSDLRDSGSIEQDADVVMFIYRKARDKNFRIEDIPPEERNIAEVLISKHRNGPTGKVRLFFHEERASFQSLEEHRHGGDPPPQPSGNNSGGGNQPTPAPPQPPGDGEGAPETPPPPVEPMKQSS